jgi:tetratricopeptide (TPR) repeat protein
VKLSILFLMLYGSMSGGGQETFEDLFLRGLELAGQGQDVEAIQVFRIAVELDPERAPGFYNLGSLLVRQGRSAEALEAFREAARLAPEEPAYQFAFGEALYRAGDIDGATPALEKAASPPNPVPEALQLLAALHEKAGNKQEAWAALGRYLELRPDDIEVRILLGAQFAGNRLYPEALAVWKEGLSGGEALEELNYRIGEALSRTREGYQEAESYLRKALEIDAEHLEARMLLGHVLVRQDHIEQGLKELSQAARDHPESPDAHYALAGVYQRLGRSEEAQAERQQFQDLNREAERQAHGASQALVAYKDAKALLDKGRLLEAESAFEAVLALDPDNVAACSMLAKITYSKGDVVGALQWIGQALQKDDSSGELHYLRALFSMKNGNLAEAELSAVRSLELMPGYPDGWMLLGSILVDADRAQEAVAAFRKAEALEPSSPIIQLNLASAYEAMGMASEEEQAMERYRSLTQSQEVKH